MSKLKYNITKFPVIILSAPRTGSTALLYELNDLLNVIVISEPLNSNELSFKDIENFTKIMQDDNRYIVKIHLHDLLSSTDGNKKIIQNIILNHIKNNDCTLIRLRRKDVIDQITSFYIALVRNIWSAPATIDLSINMSSSVAIIPSQMAFAAHVILSCNESLNDFSDPIDMDVWYEDADLPTNILVPIPKPENYLQIYRMVEKMLDALKG
jgi:hypothetical protein